MRSLLQSLIPACRHQFSWPRRDDSGENYQVCIRCGAKYSYDWATMRRIAPLSSDEEETTAPRARRKCGSKQAWVPRERRLRHQVPVRFRVLGADDWNEGVSENLSRSGLLFRATVPVEMASSIEVRLEMPRELAGDDNCQVLCEGRVVRVEPIPPTRANKQAMYAIACSIAQYRFLDSPV